MKILILANDSTYVYNLRREIIQAIREKNWNITIACEAKQHCAHLEQMGCKMIFIYSDRHGKNPAHDIRLFMKYYRILRREKPNVVLTYNIKPNIYGGIASNILKIPYIGNICGLGTPLENRSFLQCLTIWMYKIGESGAKYVFFQNAENRNFFEEHRMLSSKTKVKLLPGSGVNLQKHLPLPYPDGNTVHFQYTSRILKEKGIDIYLAAAKQIHSEYSHTVFHICGGCDDEKYLKILEEAHKDGYIVYHGEQQDMTPFLMQASCIVHPSYYPEGMSNVLLESAASARPVITTDRSGCRETVEDGVTGFLIPTQNTRALIEALKKFLEMSQEERCAMGLAGRKRMEQKFDRKKVVAFYLDALSHMKKE